MVAAGLVDQARAGGIAALALRSMPSDCDTGFAHCDFCPQNLVVDRGGLVRAIDNDSMAYDALDYDLARWWYRWPMPEADRAAFLRGYGRHRSPAAFQRHFDFWMVLAFAESVMFHIKSGTGCEHTPAAALLALVPRPPA
jgi:Ser/Thr protein kinase RdoA (MazF antagonist)